MALRPLLSRLPMRTMGCSKEGTRPAITCLPVCRPGWGLTELGNVQRPGEPKAGGSSQWPSVPVQHLWGLCQLGEAGHEAHRLSF